MKKISLNRVIKAVEGKFSGNNSDYINAVFYDSRNINSRKNINSLFVATKGEKVDGHKFVKSAFDAGARYALVDHKPDNISSSDQLIFVEETVKALGKLAKEYISQFELKFIGVTGSVGKSLTKEFIANVLSQKFHTYKNKGNLNSLIGLPFALFSIEEQHEIAVMEMASNHFGEIKQLSKIVEPDIAVITNIAAAHTKFFHNLQGVFKEKTDIFKFAQKDAKKIFNGDQKFFQKFKGKNNYFSFGKKNDNDFLIDKIELETDHYSFHMNDKKFNIFNDFKKNVFNAVPAIILGNLFDIPTNMIQKGLEIPPDLALRIDKRVNKNRKWEIIADCYNANPKSMEAGIQYLLQSELPHKIAILGDMLELGEGEIEEHQKLGEFIKNTNIEKLISVGKLARYFDGDEHFSSVEELLDLKDEFTFPENTTILLKGSRFIELEKLIERLLK